jgi:protein-tyrosine-phosphatase
MAEHLLRARLVDVAPEVTVSSMGLLFDGRPAEPKAVRAARRLGADLSEHRARALIAEELLASSLILGMERHHLRAVFEVSEELFGRTFTLPEFVRSAALFGPRPAGEPLRAWAERIGALRPRHAYEHDDPMTAIADPMGRSRRAFRATAAEIDQHLAELVALAWPPAEPAAPPVAPATTGGTP